MPHPSFETTASLIAACIARDSAAWDRFTTRYAPLVRTSVIRRLKKYGFLLPAEDIEDIGQEVFTVLWKNGSLARLEQIDRLPYWLAVMAGNIAVEYMRTKRRCEGSGSVRLDAFSGDEIDRLQERALASVMNARDVFDSNELYRRVSKVIEALATTERLAIKLTLYHRQTQDEIAALLGIPVGTVASAVGRAKMKLRAALGTDFF